MRKLRFLVAAGGTGGHLFPAMAVAKEIDKQLDGNVEFVFIGTQNRIESKKVPEAGYKYIPMNLTAFPGIRLSAIKFPFRLLSSIFTSFQTIHRYNIDGLICAGAYISVPPGIAARFSDTPIFLMESNINPGKANKMLMKSAKNIFTSWKNTESYLEKEILEKVILTGNPVRENILSLPDQISSKEKLGIHKDEKFLLIIGGSLGAKAINECIQENLQTLSKLDAKIIWQTGSNFELKTTLPENIVQTEFIDDMATAYAGSDLVISRSGATAVSEICIAGKASILVPMPGASNNEQYLNAKNLADGNAAILIENKNIDNELIMNIQLLLGNEERRKQLSEKVRDYGRPNASIDIAKSIISNY